MTASSDRFGVLLMTYGSPSSLEDVERYMTAVRGGRAPDEELVAEFRRRYQVIGGSPLIQITQAQGIALEDCLNGAAYVRAGMRFSSPTVTDALRELHQLGVTRAVGIVMSPQYSDLLMGGYQGAIEAARNELDDEAPEVSLAREWHLEQDFIAVLADRVTQSLATFPSAERGSVPVLFTAHSLPRRVAEQEPLYIDQLQQTAQTVAATAGLSAERWRFCWQSAGHEPGEWMKPDFADLMPELAAQGHRSVLVAPVQFLADHLEILYDVDIGARQQAEAVGLEFRRIESLNVDERFIKALANVALETMDRQVMLGSPG